MIEQEHEQHSSRAFRVAVASVRLSVTGTLSFSFHCSGTPRVYTAQIDSFEYWTKEFHVEIANSPIPVQDETFTLPADLRPGEKAIFFIISTRGIDQSLGPSFRGLRGQRRDSNRFVRIFAQRVNIPATTLGGGEGARVPALGFALNPLRGHGRSRKPLAGLHPEV